MILGLTPVHLRVKMVVFFISSEVEGCVHLWGVPFLVFIASEVFKGCVHLRGAPFTVTESKDRDRVQNVKA